MSPKEAARLLGLMLPAPEIVVREAYRSMVRRDHPDVGGTGQHITAMKQARDILVDLSRGVKPACHVCGGDGQVLSRGFKAVPCPKGCKRPTLTRQAARRKS